MKNIQIKKISLFIILFGIFFFAGRAVAQSPALAEESAANAKLKVGEKGTFDVDGDSYDDIMVEVLSIGPAPDFKPVIKTTNLVPNEKGGSQYIASPFIGEYIAAVYKYAVMIIILLSVIMIIFAGVQWTISGGSPDKINSAKQMIVRSLTGLLIALGSYTLLFTINPDLVKFRNLQVLKVSAVATIPEDRTMPEGPPEDPPKSLEILTRFTDDQITFGPGVDAKATPEAKAALEQALDEFANYPSNNGANVDVIISTAYRSPVSQYSLMTAKCGCKTIDQILTDKDGKTIKKDIEAGQWASYCDAELLTKCKVGYKSLAFKDGRFKAPNIAHFGGNAFDISAKVTGAVKPCGDISVDELARKSAKVTNAGQYKNDWCIPKQQQLLIKAMRNNGFCVGIASGSTLREPWHFEFMGGKIQGKFCTSDGQDSNMAKLQYLQDLK